MFMKMICKEKDVNTKEDEKQAEELNRELYVIDPETDFPDVRSPEEMEGNTESTMIQVKQKEGSLVNDVIAFLAEKTADRFDYMADGMDVMVLKEIVYRMEHIDPKTAIIMLQSMFMTNELVSAAVDLDLLDIFSRYDADTYETFINELFETEVFNQFLVANWLDEAFGKTCEHACLS